MSRNSLATMINFLAADLDQPTPKMVQFVNALVEADAGSDSDQRSRQRFHMASAVPALCLNEDDIPVGEAFLIMTRNISTNGISLVHTDPIETRKLAIQLVGASDETIQLILEVVRCRPIDEYYDIGGRLLGRVGR